MTTPYRGYTEIPATVAPDVPYRVNLALREVDADIQDVAQIAGDATNTAATATATAVAARSTADKAATEAGVALNAVTELDGPNLAATVEQARTAAEEATAAAAAAIAPTDQAVEYALTTDGTASNDALLAGVESASGRVRGYARAVSSRGAPIICIARPSSNQIVSAGTPRVLSWPLEDLDTDAIHSGGATNARMTVPPGFDGVWLIKATVRMAAAAAGTSNATITIRKNGVAIDGDSKPTTGARVYLNAEIPVVAVAGDYFDVEVSQDSTTDKTVEANFSKFIAERTGDAIGVGGGVTFDSAYKYFGSSKYDQIISPESLSFVDDPVRGPSRQVARLDLHPYDNSVQYPRVQMATHPTLTAGTEIWSGFGVYVPNDFPVLTDYGSTLHEFYGPPHGGYSPTVLRLQRDTLAWWAAEPLTDPAPWSIPVTRGQWVDLAFRVKLSTDPAVGFLEIHANTGAGWVQQTIGGQARVYLATLKAGINDGGNNYSSLKITYLDPAFTGDDVLTIMYANHRLGTSLAAVDPKSFA